MDALSESAEAISFRLLQTVALLATRLNPSIGLKAGAAALVVDELKETMEQNERSMPQPVRQLLNSTISSLTSSSPSVPYVAALSAQSNLTAALQHLALPSEHSPPVFSRIPAELVAHIVLFCQDDDLRLRQNTNLALASTCRAFHAAVQPILRREVHLFTPSQVERAHYAFPENSARARGVRRMTVEIELNKLKRQDDGTWAGRRVPSVINRCDDLDELRLRFGDGLLTDSLMGDIDYQLGRTLGFGDEQKWRLGLKWLPLHRFRRLDIPLFFAVGRPCLTLADILQPSSWLRHLRLGDPSVPLSTSPEDIDEHLKHPHTICSFHHYESFCAPFLAFYPSALRKVLGPYPDNRPSMLRQLEVTMYIEDIDTDVLLIRDALLHLAPTLRHLVLRVVVDEPSFGEEERLTEVVLPALQACTLTHLEVGGNVFDRKFLQGLLELPDLPMLTLLPISSPGLSDLPYTYDFTTVGPNLRHLVVCVELAMDNPLDAFNSQWLKALLDQCEDRSLKVEIQKRTREWDWLHSFEE
ncbi:hypothetical protein JCM10207_005257 [Rhodosporidiobolus poonsookiae]